MNKSNETTEYDRILADLKKSTEPKDNPPPPTFDKGKEEEFIRKILIEKFSRKDNSFLFFD